MRRGRGPGARDFTTKRPATQRNAQFQPGEEGEEVWGREEGWLPWVDNGWRGEEAVRFC